LPVSRTDAALPSVEGAVVAVASERAPAPPRDVDPDIHRELTDIWRNGPGIWGWLRGVNHRTVGLRYIITAFIFFIVGGIEALIMRLQLARPENDLLALQTYNELFTMHGTTMMFLFVVPMVEGLAIYFLPLLIGARDFPFPRLNLFGYYCFLLGGIFVYSSFLFGHVPDGGWFAYPPLTDASFSPGINMDFWLLGVTFVELSAIAAGIEIIVGLLKFRAPGMSLGRMPLFGWNILAVAFMIILAFPALIFASVMLEFDRAFGTQFFNPGAGGDSVLWQHLFWAFGHPEVYIQFLPAAGVISMVIPVFSRRPIIGYVLLAASGLAIAFLSFGLWSHHMYTTGALAVLAATFVAGSSAMIAIPNGVQMFSWIATIWAGRPVLRTPLLFALGFLVLFVLGGVTGVMVAMPAFDRQVHDTFFVVAHFHYVLIGGVVFPFFAAFYYWFPKVSGRMLSDGLGVLTFVLMFIGFNLTFFPMHIVGLLGMPRRIGIYDAGLGWDWYNLLATVGAFVLALGVLVFIVDVVTAWRRPRDAGNDPWLGNSLEWATESPPAQYNFAVTPRVRSRDPLWEEPDRLYDHEAAPDGSTPLAVQMSRAHRGQREALVTAALDAEPQYLVVLPGNSVAPLLLALSAGAVFLGFITSYWITFAGLIASAAVILYWTWPGEPEGASERPRPGARHEGPRSTGWWGMVMLIIFSAALLVPLVYAYVHVWSINTEWPPPFIDVPGLLMPAVLTAVLVASSAVVWYGNGGRLEEADRRLRRGFPIALLLGVAFLLLQGYELRRLEFDWTDHAYASIFYVLNGFHALGAAMAVVLVAWSLWRYRLGHYREGHRNSPDVAALFWHYMVVVWFVVLVVAYILPRFGATAPEFQL
jgi:cytochrome c oxidase subunit I+III